MKNSLPFMSRARFDLHQGLMKYFVFFVKLMKRVCQYRSELSMRHDQGRRIDPKK